jgi:hypothetical protein
MLSIRSVSQAFPELSKTCMYCTMDIDINVMFCAREPLKIKTIPINNFTKI